MNQAFCELHSYVPIAALGSADLAPDLLVCVCRCVCMYVCVSTCVLWLGKSAITDDESSPHILLGRLLSVPSFEGQVECNSSPRNSFLLIL